MFWYARQFSSAVTQYRRTLRLDSPTTRLPPALSRTEGTRSGRGSAPRAPHGHAREARVFLDDQHYAVRVLRADRAHPVAPSLAPDDEEEVEPAGADASPGRDRESGATLRRDHAEPFGIPVAAEKVDVDVASVMAADRDLRVHERSARAKHRARGEQGRRPGKRSSHVRVFRVRCRDGAVHPAAVACGGIRTYVRGRIGGDARPRLA